MAIIIELVETRAGRFRAVLVETYSLGQYVPAGEERRKFGGDFETAADALRYAADRLSDFL